MGCSCTKYNAGARKHLVYHYHTCRHRLWVVVHLLETARAGYQVTVSCSQGLSYICNKHSLSHTREMLAPTSVASYACILPRPPKVSKHLQSYSKSSRTNLMPGYNAPLMACKLFVDQLYTITNHILEPTYSCTTHSMCFLTKLFVFYKWQ